MKAHMRLTRLVRDSSYILVGLTLGLLIVATASSFGVSPWWGNCHDGLIVEETFSITDEPGGVNTPLMAAEAVAQEVGSTETGALLTVSRELDELAYELVFGGSVAMGTVEVQLVGDTYYPDSYAICAVSPDGDPFFQD